jgi:hypothetical protein
LVTGYLAGFPNKRHLCTETSASARISKFCFHKEIPGIKLSHLVNWKLIPSSLWYYTAWLFKALLNSTEKKTGGLR